VSGNGNGDGDPLISGFWGVQGAMPGPEARAAFQGEAAGKGGSGVDHPDSGAPEKEIPVKTSALQREFALERVVFRVPARRMRPVWMFLSLRNAQSISVKCH
jgi:hypothetical protein